LGSSTFVAVGQITRIPQPIQIKITTSIAFIAGLFKSETAEKTTNDGNEKMRYDRGMRRYNKI